jgi:hypothetical protein
MPTKTILLSGRPTKLNVPARWRRTGGAHAFKPQREEGTWTPLEAFCAFRPETGSSDSVDHAVVLRASTEHHNVARFRVLLHHGTDEEGRSLHEVEVHAVPRPDATTKAPRPVRSGNALLEDLAGVASYYRADAESAMPGALDALQTLARQWNLPGPYAMARIEGKWPKKPGRSSAYAVNRLLVADLRCGQAIVLKGPEADDVEESIRRGADWARRERKRLSQMIKCASQGGEVPLDQSAALWMATEVALGRRRRRHGSPLYGDPTDVENWIIALGPQGATAHGNYMRMWDEENNGLREEFEPSLDLRRWSPEEWAADPCQDPDATLPAWVTQR